MKLKLFTSLLLALFGK